MKFGKFFGDIQGYLIGISSIDIQGIYYACFVYEVLVIWYKGYCVMGRVGGCLTSIGTLRQY